MYKDIKNKLIIKLKIFLKKITYSFPILIAFTRLYFFFISFALRF